MNFARNFLDVLSSPQSSYRAISPEKSVNPALEETNNEKVEAEATVEDNKVEVAEEAVIVALNMEVIKADPSETTKTMMEVDLPTDNKTISMIARMVEMKESLVWTTAMRTPIRATRAVVAEISATTTFLLPDVMMDAVEATIDKTIDVEIKLTAATAGPMEDDMTTEETTDAMIDVMTDGMIIEEVATEVEEEEATEETTEEAAKAIAETIVTTLTVATMETMKRGISRREKEMVMTRLICSQVLLSVASTKTSSHSLFNLYHLL